jgi:hypothetical protein
MGKVAGVATDVFFCLFGIFAALFAIAPKEPFGLPSRPILSVSWPASSADDCLFNLVLVADGKSVDLSLPHPSFAAFGGGSCNWDRIVEGVSEVATVIEVILTTPYLNGCAEVKFGDLEEEKVCTDVPGTKFATQSENLSNGV